MDDILKALLGLGPGGVVAATFAYMWYSERGERREANGANVQLLREKIVSDNALASALEKIAERVQA